LTVDNESAFDDEVEEAVDDFGSTTVILGGEGAATDGRPTEVGGGAFDGGFRVVGGVITIFGMAVELIELSSSFWSVVTGASSTLDTPSVVVGDIGVSIVIVDVGGAVVVVDVGGVVVDDVGGTVIVDEVGGAAIVDVGGAVVVDDVGGVGGAVVVDDVGGTAVDDVGGVGDVVVVVDDVSGAVDVNFVGDGDGGGGVVVVGVVD
jgi:hypothetical protein